jgi:hypothetical protein
MHKPVVLQRFLEIGRRVGRDISAYPGDFFQLRASLWLCLCLSLPGRQFSVALCEANDRACCDMHSAQFLLFVIGFRIVQKVQGSQSSINLCLEVQHSFMVDLVVQNSVARRALFHKFCKNPGFVRGLPLIGHFAEN